MLKNKTFIILVVVSIIFLAAYLVLNQDGKSNSELTEVEIDALYAISELGESEPESEARFCHFELLDQSYVSITLVCQTKVDEMEFLSFLDDVIPEFQKFKRIDIYVASMDYGDEILDRLQLLDNISRIMFTIEVSSGFSEKFDLICEKKNWLRIKKRVFGKNVFLYPKFETHTKESLRRQNLGWWGRLMEDIGIY